MTIDTGDRIITITRRRRPTTAYMGRFGGGWQWKVGAQAGTLTRERGSILLSLLTFELTIHWKIA